MNEFHAPEPFDLEESEEMELPQRPNPFSFLAGIWVHPRRTLEQVSEHPGWSWLIPMVLVALLMVVQVVVTAPIQQRISQETIKQMMEKQKVEIQQATPKGQPPVEVPEEPVPSIPVTPMIILGAVGGTVGLIISWLVRAGVLHLLAMGLGGRHRFGQMFAMTAWATMPTTLRQILQIAYSLITGDLVKNPGLSWLVSKPTTAQTSTEIIREMQHPLAALLKQIDIFTFWYVVLLFIGIGVTAHLSKKKTAVVLAIYLLLAAAVYVIPALVTKALMGGMGGAGF